MSKVVNEHIVRKTLLLNPEKLQKVRMILDVSRETMLVTFWLLFALLTSEQNLLRKMQNI